MAIPLNRTMRTLILRSVCVFAAPALALLPAAAAAGPFSASVTVLTVAPGLEFDLLAANAGNADAQVRVGIRYATGDGVAADPIEAAHWFRRAAQEGDVESQFNMGVLYMNGQGVPEDPAEAAYWFRRAAGQAHSRAQHNLGVLYRLGLGVEQDVAAAAEWFRRAAQQGEPSAQASLGVMHAEGVGVPQDYFEAYAWFGAAAESGEIEAVRLQASVAPQLGGETQRAEELEARYVSLYVEPFRGS